MLNSLKLLVVAFVYSLVLQSSFVSVFQWPSEVLEGWKLHKQYLENGSFLLKQHSDAGPESKKTLYCRNGEYVLEDIDDNEVRVSVFRSGSYFVVAKQHSSSRWELRQLSPTPENRIALSPYAFFPYAFFGTEFPDDKYREYSATSPFNPNEKFTVGWRNKANPKIHGSLVFDPKKSWGCVEMQYINENAIEAKHIATYDSMHLSSVRIVDPKSPETFSLVMISPSPARAELFTLEHYGHSEDLLRNKAE